MQQQALSELEKVVVFGLGAMGRPMARNLHQHDLLIGVKNRTEGKAKSIQKELQLTEFSDDKEMFAAADCVLTCVSADEDLLSVIAQIKPHLHSGMVIIDSSTVKSETVRHIAEDLAKIEVGFIDAPVSGGVEGAKKGSLSVMVGASAENFKRAGKVFSAIGGQITHLGKVGQGQAAKAVNQIMVAGIAQAVCGALAFAEQSNLNMPKIIDVLTAGAAGNWFLENRGQTMCNNEFNVGFKLSLLHKDLKICQQSLAALGANMKIVDDSIADYATLMEQNHGDDDISGLIRLRRENFSEQQK